MKRSFLLQTAWLTAVIVWGSPLMGEDAPVQREDIGRALEMYRWLIDHEEFNAAGKLAAELQAIHPDDPQVQLIVENAQLRAAVREANRVLVDDEPALPFEIAPPVQQEPAPEWGAFAETPPGPFHPEINWRELGHILDSPPVQFEVVPTSGIASDEPSTLIDSAADWDRMREFRALLEDDEQRAEQQRLSSEARIRMTLTEPISLHFDAGPLTEVMRHIAGTHSLNIVVDETGLQEAGVTRDTPVTINVDGVTLKSALNLVLKPLNLDFRIEDEVIKITSHLQAMGGLTTRVYSVPDLVMPIPHRTPGSVEDKLTEMAGPPDAGFDALVELITTTIQPDSWSHVGGQGFIHQHKDTLSLVIRQTQPAHDEIADLLRHLRSLRQSQVTHVMELLSVPVSELGELGLSGEECVCVISANEQSDYKARVFGAGSQYRIRNLPSITLFNCQTGSVVDSKRTLLISSVSSPDRSTIRLNVAAPESLEAGDVMSAVHSAIVPDGGVALILLSDSAHLISENNLADVLAITPHVQTPEEEEEFLGIPVP